MLECCKNAFSTREKQLCFHLLIKINFTQAGKQAIIQIRTKHACNTERENPLSLKYTSQSALLKKGNYFSNILCYFESISKLKTSPKCLLSRKDLCLLAFGKLSCLSNVVKTTGGSWSHSQQEEKKKKVNGEKYFKIVKW